MTIYEEVTAYYNAFLGEKISIGKSSFGHTMYAMKVGNGRPCGIVQCSIHGREWITAKLCFALIERGVALGSCWFLPLTNPDGALLSQMGLASVKNEKDRIRLQSWQGNADFSLWKANGRGVDLNVNFPAKWGEGVKNTRTPGSENYVGKAPLSEKESQALARFTKWILPDYTVSYHTKGEEIYWKFGNSTHTCPLSKRLAEVLSQTTGYPLCEAEGSVGGYKDWCLEHLRIPSFTIEVGKDEWQHPLGEEALPELIEKNQEAIYRLSEEWK